MLTEGKEHVRIDVLDLEEILRRETHLETLRRETHLNIDSSPVCIFEVPTCLKDLKQDVYVPKVVGLGPLHHDDPLPHDNLNELKKKAVLETLGKINRYDPLRDAIEELRSEVTEMKEQIQQCYEKSFSFDPDIFILDSCFLLEFFLIPHKSKASYSEIKRDLMKLENQIPLILLQKLLTLQGHNADDMVVKMGRNLFGDFFVRGPLETSLRAFSKIEKRPRHLLEYGQQFVSGFIRDAAALEGNNDEEKGWYGLYNTKKSEDDDVMWFFPSAHQLEKAGIELRRGDKLSFERKWWGLKGVLTIPGIVIDDSMEVGLKNIIAFEDCLPCGERLVTGFVEFLDCLIDKDTDVGVLRRANIIDNLLESDQAVANLVNSCCVNVTAPGNLKCLKERMEAYYSSSWRVTIMELMDRPFHVMGTLLLGLTIVQTVYSVKSYKAGE